MLFNSPIFLLFLALLLPAYALTRNDTARRCILLVFSYWFYSYWDWRYLLLLLASTVLDWTCGRMIYRSQSPAKRRFWLVCSLIGNLGMLSVFKYGRFLLGIVGLPGDFLPKEIPVGISFYTFQTMTYTIDLYRGVVRPARNPLDFALYVAFFPQLIAGPIVRAVEFLPQLERPLADLSWRRMAEGFQRFALGMFKKVAIADNVGLFVNAVFLTPGKEDALTLWAGAWGFALLIYCDFSAYSDMAIGLAHAFGFVLPENFDRPYLSRSITEFWRRWHMSLSRWLRDYLYVSLGGNRISKARTYVNLMTTMLLGGLWHGANWTYVIWGGWHGALLAVERRLGVRPPSDEMHRPGLFVRLLQVLLTFQLVVLGWVMFRAPSLDVAWLYLRRMFTAFDLEHARAFAHDFVFRWSFDMPKGAAFWTRFVLAFLCCQWLAQRFRLRETLWMRLPSLAQGLVLAMLWLAASLLAVDEVKFIYFQF